MIVIKEATRVRAVLGDIAEHPCQAVVCAANDQFAMGGGVAGALRFKGGPELEREARARAGQALAEGSGVPLGTVVRTAGYALQAEFVYHAAVIRYDLRGGSNAADVLVAYREILRSAVRDGVTVLGVPLLGAGVGGLGPKASCELLLQAVEERGQTQQRMCVDIVSINADEFELAEATVDGYLPPAEREALIDTEAERYLAALTEARQEPEP
jgi:O-acetyl-ADP-ribose deacetylase